MFFKGLSDRADLVISLLYFFLKQAKSVVLGKNKMFLG
jgi:hypothetical protein